MDIKDNQGPKSGADLFSCHAGADQTSTKTGTDLFFFHAKTGTDLFLLPALWGGPF